MKRYECITVHYGSLDLLNADVAKNQRHQSARPTCLGQRRVQSHAKVLRAAASRVSRRL